MFSTHAEVRIALRTARGSVLRQEGNYVDFSRTLFLLFRGVQSGTARKPTCSDSPPSPKARSQLERNTAEWDKGAALDCW